MTAVIAALEDLDIFVSILDDCGTIYGRRYRVALDRLRAAINNTGPAATSGSKDDMAGPVTHHADESSAMISHQARCPHACIPDIISTDAPGETPSTGSKSENVGMPGACLYERSPAETAGACPLKPGLRCHATVELATESRCDCPRILQYDLYNHHARRRPQEVPA